MKYERLTDNDVKYIKDNVHDLDRLLLFLNALLEDAYKSGYITGFNDGFDG